MENQCWKKCLMNCVKNLMLGKVPGELREKLMLENVPWEVRGTLMLEKVPGELRGKTDVGKSAWGTA